MNSRLVNEMLSVDVDHSNAAQHACASRARELAAQLAQAFELPGVHGECQLMYGNEIALTVFLAAGGRPTEAMGIATRDAATAAVTLELSLRGPLVTATASRPMLAIEAASPGSRLPLSDRSAWKVGLPLDDLAAIARPWIDWLCLKHNLTYMPVEVLEGEIEDRWRELDDGPATAYSVLFRE